MKYTMRDGIPVYSSDAVNPNNLTQSERDDVIAFVAQEVTDQASAETTRLSKRPKRSEINAAKASTSAATTLPELRTAVSNLMDLLDNVLAFQRVDVDEDAG